MFVWVFRCLVYVCVYGIYGIDNGSLFKYYIRDYTAVYFPGIIISAVNKWDFINISSSAILLKLRIFIYVKIYLCISRSHLRENVPPNGVPNLFLCELKNVMIRRAIGWAICDDLS